MARMVADLLEVVGIDHVVTVDPHTAQIEGFFYAPVDSLRAVPTLCRALRGRLPLGIVIVAPDAGRVEMATRYARCLGAPVAVLHKRQVSGAETAVTHMAGEVSGRPCLIVDDMISTEAPLRKASECSSKGIRRLQVFRRPVPLARRKLEQRYGRVAFLFRYQDRHCGRMPR